MKVRENTKEPATVTLGDLKPGDVFRFKNSVRDSDLFLRGIPREDDRIQVTWLREGVQLSDRPDEEVIKINGEFVVQP